MLIHFVVGLIIAFIYHCFFTDQSFLAILLVSTVASFFPDADHLLYIFWYGKEQEYGMKARKLILSGDIKGYCTFAKYHHKENLGLYSHNMVTIVFFLLLSLYFSLLDQNPLGSVFFIAAAFHLIYDLLEDLVFFGKINPNWILRFNGEEQINVFIPKKLKIFMKLIRFVPNIVTSIPLYVMYLFGKNFDITLRDFFFISFCYFIFTICLYGGIYIFNDLHDLESDKKHPYKSKGRCIASGEVSPSTALRLGIYLIVTALLLGGLVSRTFLLFELTFIVANALYTFVLKKYPYVDILGNTVTHPLRSITGLVLSGVNLKLYTALIITDILGEMSATIARRSREHMNGFLEARPTLKKTNKTVLFVAQNVLILVLWVHFFYTLNEPGFIVRLVYILICTIPNVFYGPKSIFKILVDKWTYGNSEAVLVVDTNAKSN